MTQSALPIEPEHDPCCSSHGVPMDCERYRRTHFVEVRPCCSVDAARLRQEQAPATPKVKAKAPKPEAKPRGPEPEHCPHCGRFMKGAYPVWQCLIHGTITA